MAASDRQEAVYDSIGTEYGRSRRSDPRIAAQIAATIEEGDSVLNVGAGTGSYEPSGPRVVAAEPSALMIEQRPREAAPAVKASAEELPFVDASVDVVMAANTVHHWTGLEAGLAEMRRVARKRVTILTMDPEVASSVWITQDYFPAGGEIQRRMLPPVERLAAALGGATVQPLPVLRDCQDEFTVALWGRPERLLEHAQYKGSSLWHLLEAEAVEAGSARLRTELEGGLWDERYGRLRTLDELDVGLRLVVADVGR